jgi:hypothetical protein
MGIDLLNPKSVMVKISETKILILEARSTAGLDVIPNDSAGVLVYTVDMTIPTIKGMATTYPRPGGRNDLSDAPLHIGDSISVEGVKIRVNSGGANSYSVTISRA